MRILKLSTAPSGYMAYFFESVRATSGNSHELLKRKLENDACGWTDCWTNTLSVLGYEGENIYANAWPVQKKWAEVHGIEFPSKHWMFDVAKAQIKEFRPEILFINDYHSFSKDYINEVREASPSIRLVAGWCGAPFQDKTVFDAYDIVLTNIPDLRNRFRAMGHQCELIAHAFDPRVLDRIQSSVSTSIPFSFVGSVWRNNEAHMRRERLLITLLQQVPIEIFSPSAEIAFMDGFRNWSKRRLFELSRPMKWVPGLEALMGRIPVLKKVATLTKKPERLVHPAIKPALRPAVYGLQMFETLKRSNCTLNTHIDLSGDFATNMRLFEATGMGTCLLTDAKSNLHNLFELDHEVVAYNNEAECVEKARWLADHPEKCLEIGLAGQRRTLREHTFAHRAPLLHAVLKKYLP